MQSEYSNFPIEKGRKAEMFSIKSGRYPQFGKYSKTSLWRPTEIKAALLSGTIFTKSEWLLHYCSIANIKITQQIRPHLTVRNVVLTAEFYSSFLLNNTLVKTPSLKRNNFNLSSATAIQNHPQ